MTESYSYDGDGLRQTVTTDDQRRHEAWDLSGSTPVMITDGPTSYITGPGGLPVEQIAADGTVRYFSHDQLGSTTALTDASGTTVQRYSYDAYGQLTSAAPTVENPFQYAGQYTDATTGLQYLRARYYDPSTGQFISRDPLEGETLQPYAYAGNDPINNADPTGLDVLDRISDAVSSVVPSGVSDAAARTLDVITGGAASDIACNGLNWSNGAEAGVNLAMTIVPGGFEEREALSVARQAVNDLDAAFTTIERDASGRVKRYTTYHRSDPRDPNEFRPHLRFDREGKVHYDKTTGEPVPTPHVHDPAAPGRVRPAGPEDIPR